VLEHVSLYYIVYILVYKMFHGLAFTINIYGTLLSWCFA